MQFILIAYDRQDPEAPTRRTQAREDHLRQAKAMFDQGRWLYAAGILNDQGQLAGSMIVCDYASREALEREWLQREPYVLHKVWGEVRVHRAQVAPFLTRKAEGS